MCPCGTHPVTCGEGNGLPCGNVTRLLPNFKEFDIMSAIVPCRMFHGVISCRERVTVTGGGVGILVVTGSLLNGGPTRAVCHVTTSNMLCVSSRSSTGLIGTRGIHCLRDQVGGCVARLKRLVRRVRRATGVRYSVAPRHCNRVTGDTNGKIASRTIVHKDVNSIVVRFVFSGVERQSCRTRVSCAGLT